MVFSDFLAVAKSEQTSLSEVNMAIIAIIQSGATQVIGDREAKLIEEIAMIISSVLDGQQLHFDALMDLDNAVTVFENP